MELPTEKSEPEIRKQVLVTSVVDEILSSTSDHQRGLLRILSVARLHQLEPATVLDGFSRSTPQEFSIALGQFADLLESGVSEVPALAQVPGLIPAPVAEALQVADRHGAMDDVGRELLRSNVVATARPGQVEEAELVDVILSVAKKYAFAIAIVSFIMLFIVPQFKAMFDEFGIEMPESMQYAVAFSNRIVQLWFLVPLVILVTFVILIIRKPHFLTRYFLGWLPSRWNEPTVSKDIQQKLVAAWQQFDPGGEPAQRADDGKSKARSPSPKMAFSPREKKVIQTASSNETRTWLLRQMAGNKIALQQQRWYWGVQTLSAIANGVLMLFVFLIVVGVFQCLLTIIRGLTG